MIGGCDGSILRGERFDWEERMWRNWKYGDEGECDIWEWCYFW